MNREHLKTFLWLRWRLVANMNKRQGLLITIIGYLAIVFFGLGALASLVTGFLLGYTKMAYLPTQQYMTIWQILVMFYLTFWLTGLLAELQRSDILSLDMFLQLPVTPTAAFLINYLGSSISLTSVIFLSLMGGITLGLLASIGLEMLMLVLLVASFFLMITALTYQFRGWLASMMTTPRRRQVILGILTIAFLLIFMSPSFMAFYHKAAGGRGSADTGAVMTVQGGENSHAAKTAHKVDRIRAPLTGGDRALLQSRLQLANYIFPPGWLSVGAVNTFQGRIFPALVTMIGMLLIGIWSLLRSYRTTLRMYKGDFNSARSFTRPEQPSSDADVSAATPAQSVLFLELRLPWVSDHVSAIALANLRAKLRDTGVKFMFILPIILMSIFGGFVINRLSGQSEFLKPLIAAGMAAFILFVSMIYVIGNIFAYDRDGFRALLLSSATRRDVLLGKNLSLFPIAFSLMLFSILVANWFQPMRPDHLLAAILQSIPLYLILCMYGNLLSIFLPMTVRGNGMPASGQNVKILIRELSGLLTLSILTLTFIPLGIEFLMYLLDWHTGFPAYLFFMIIESGLVIWLYTSILDYQAEQFYQREQRILAVVTARVE